MRDIFYLWVVLFAPLWSMVNTILTPTAPHDDAADFGGNEMQNRKQKGFSLLEILIAMAILVTVAGAFVIVGMRAQARGNSTTALQSLQSIASDESAYQNSWGGFSPTASALGGLENANTTAATALLDEEINTADATALDAGLVRSGYKMLFVKGGVASTGTGGAAVQTGFEIAATPVSVSSGGSAYCVDPSGAWVDTLGLAVPSTGVCKTDGFVTQLGQ